MPLTFPLFLSAVLLAAAAPVLLAALGVALTSRKHRAFARQVLTASGASFTVVATGVLSINASMSGFSVSSLQLAAFFGATIFSVVTILRSYMLWRQSSLSAPHVPS